MNTGIIRRSIFPFVTKLAPSLTHNILSLVLMSDETADADVYNIQTHTHTLLDL